MTEIESRKCAAKYCRAASAANKKYCPKHESMTGGEIIAEGNHEIILSWDQVQALVRYALEDILRRSKQ